MKKENFDNKFASIPADMFTPVNKDKVLLDQKLDTKPVGFLMDAWRRFKKNKGAVVAGIIIIVMILFAIIAPFCSPYSMDQAFGYYKQSRPKIAIMDSTGTGFWDGTYVKDQPYQDYVNLMGIAAGALYDGTDSVAKWEDVENSQYNPIKKVLKSYSQTLLIDGNEIKQDRFEYRVDSYYEVGFVAIAGLTMQDYFDILDWEEKTGKKVIYPIVDTSNKDAFNQANLNEVYQENYWYWHDSKNNPIDKDGNILTLEQIKENGLVANYRYGYNETEEGGEYVCDGTNYVLIAELSDEELLRDFVKKVSPFKLDTKGAYAYVDGEYVLASTLSEEEQATNTARYKWNYVAVKESEGEYVLDGAQYKKVADLTKEELANACARYEGVFTPSSNPKEATFILYEGKYIDFLEYQTITGQGLMEWNAINEKFKGTFVLSDDGEYVINEQQKYVRLDSIPAEKRSSLVKYYNLVWDTESKTKAPGTHMYSGGEYVEIAGMTDQELIDLIPRYEHGLMMYKQTGAGGKNLTVRVLYYNYHQYLYDAEPMFMFGADAQGFDILIRLAQGARLSFILAIVVAIINMFIGVIYGSIQGYYGGKLDLVMEYLSEILNSIPTIILVTLFKLHFVDTGKISQLGALILAFISTGWIGMAYGVRMQFYRFKGQEYVLAARTLGASDFRLIFRHIFPNAIGTLITSWAFILPNIINAETSYSYLGIINFNGTDMTSIGTMLANGQAAGIDRFPHIVFFPALILGLLMIAFNLFGNGLRDAFNPSLRGSED